MGSGVTGAGRAGPRWEPPAVPARPLSRGEPGTRAPCACQRGLIPAASRERGSGTRTHSNTHTLYTQAHTHTTLFPHRHTRTHITATHTAHYAQSHTCTHFTRSHTCAHTLHTGTHTYHTFNTDTCTHFTATHTAQSLHTVTHAQLTVYTQSYRTLVTHTHLTHSHTHIAHFTHSHTRAHTSHTPTLTHSHRLTSPKNKRPSSGTLQIKPILRRNSLKETQSAEMQFCWETAVNLIMQSNLAPRRRERLCHRA